MQLEWNEIDQASNPFRLEPTSERVLAYGERARELELLSAQKYNLIQKIADNRDYVDNLSKKRLNIRSERQGLISDIKQITKIPHLAPHIGGSQTARNMAKSPSPTASQGNLLGPSMKAILGPIASRNRLIN